MIHRCIHWMSKLLRGLTSAGMQKTAGSLLAVWLVLAGLIWGAGPALLRSVLTERLGQALQRQVSIERITINPINGSLTVQGLSVRTPSGHEQIGFAQLNVNFSSLSIVQGGIVVDALWLQGPRVSVARLGDGRYDISDWLAQWLQPQDSSSSSLPRFSLNNIQVTDGQLIFDDRPKGVRHTVESIRLSVPFVSSLPYQAQVFVEPEFSAVVDGAPLALHGRAQPFAPSHNSAIDIDLEDLDLGQLQPYWPASLPVRVPSGQLRARLALDFSQPPNSAPALTVSGTAKLRQLSLTEASGQPWLGLQSLDLTLQKAEPLKGLWLIQKLTLQGLAVGQDNGQRPLRAAQLSADELQLDLPARHLEARQLAGTGIQSRMLRTEAGQLQWIALPKPTASVRSADSGAPTASAGKASDWTIRLAQLGLEEMAFRFEDRSLTPTAIQDLTHVNLKMDKLELRGDHENAFDLTAAVNQSGRIQAHGTMQLQPWAAHLKLETQALPMVPMQGYMAPYLNTSIVQGLISSKGELDIRMPADKLQARYKGTLTLGQLQAIDPASHGDFLRWKSLYFGGIDFALAPGRLHIDEIALSDFYSRLILQPDGRLNLADILRLPQGKRKNPESSAEADKATAWPVEIAKVTLQNGQVDFSDQFVQPHYSASVSRLGGSVRNLSSAAETQAELDLRGSYANNAPVLIAARLNPLSEKKSLDLRAEISSVDLVDFSPYSGKYAGYKIDKGKLSLNASYKLANRQLTADNRVFIDQLTFGEKVDSPDATQLPVTLAIALLKNNRGEIDINLPIAGSLDDPQFSISGLIFKVIANLFAKAVTSPFALLGSMFGDNQELSQIGFAPGRARLEEPALTKLQTLAKAMREREGLKLEITAGADQAIDPEGLRRALLARAVLAEKRKDLAKQRQETPADELGLQPGEYALYLARAYQQARFPKPRNLIGLPKELSVGDMEKLMLASLPVGEEELRALATQRAQAVQTWLVEQGQIPLSRLFLLPVQLAETPQTTARTGRNRVDFSLR